MLKSSFAFRTSAHVLTSPSSSGGIFVYQSGILNAGRASILSRRSLGNTNLSSNLSPFQTMKQRQFSTSTPPSAFSNWFAERPALVKYSRAWWKEQLLICVVFAITGSSTMFLVRPLLRDGLQLEGSLKEGPWSFRLAYLAIMTPVYSCMLVAVGTLFGRHAYFRRFAVKMWSRFLPESIRRKLL
eukprot:TRINITY_DN16276_c0_g1_i1.p1 TRINITY_DN16276_c0_g1~~TRINITY_DN16276_c0_g1_i1.p1  ORF type:complete len:185 (-),score=0.56 TRINITY_DN16276_c0_g1_i1:161-715(-)